MLRRVCVILLLLVLVLPAAAEQPRKVVWITIDALRAGNLHFMGYEKQTSPWLDKLAGESVVFKRAFSPANITVRSVPAYMTGKFPSELFPNPSEKYDKLPEEFKTLAEAFKEAGYKTHWFTANPNASGKGQIQGVEDYRKLFPQSTVKASVDDIIRVLRAGHKPTNAREFFYIHLEDVHDPYRPPIPYDTMFSPLYKRALVREGIALDEDGKRFYSKLPYFSETHDLENIDIDFLIGLYDGAIRYTDSRLQDLLQSVGFDKTKDLLIVTSDHGEQFFEHGFLGHGRSIRSQDFHVPLIVSYAGFAPGDCPDSVSLLDLYPTLAELCGLEAPKGLRGTSLLPTLQGKNQEAHPVICESGGFRGRSVVLINQSNYYALNTQAYKLRPWLTWPYRELLFDLDKDPRCFDNILNEFPDKAKKSNIEMRELNPRFKPYSSDLISRGNNKAKLGPNLLKTGTEWPELKDIPQLKTLKSGALTFEQPGAKIVLPATVSAPNELHMLELEFGLESGWLSLELKDTAKQRGIWKYTFRKPKKPGTVFRSMLLPKSKNIQIEIYFEKPGKANIKSISLRACNIETIWPRKWPVQLQASSNPPQHKMSDAERARMETLGYL